MELCPGMLLLCNKGMGYLESYSITDLETKGRISNCVFKLLCH